MRAVLLVVLLLAPACAPGAGEAPALPEQPRELQLAAAANMSFALQELVPAFEAQERARLRFSLGSSGNFYAQIANGAPFDVFLSADAVFPQRLQEAGLAEPGTLTSYAVGRLVLWSRKVPLDAGLQSLLGVERVAIANPELAPYGQAAVAAMEHYGLYAQVRPKLVLGENVSQAAQFAESGAAEVALIPLSLASVAPLNGAGSYWLVPAEAHARIEQAAVVLRGARDPGLGRAFLAYLTGIEGRAILARSGFEGLSPYPSP